MKTKDMLTSNISLDMHDSKQAMIGQIGGRSHGNSSAYKPLQI